MVKQRKTVHRVQIAEGKRNIIHQLLKEYNIQTAEDIQAALKDLLGGTIKEMMEAEMDDHLGYEKSERSDNRIIAMVISASESIVAMVPWRSMSRRIGNSLLNHRW